VKSEQIVCKTIVLGAVPRPVFSKGKLKNKCFKFINYKKIKRTWLQQINQVQVR
jgi:hypothetical protein